MPNFRAVSLPQALLQLFSRSKSAISKISKIFCKVLFCQYLKTKQPLTACIERCLRGTKAAPGSGCNACAISPPSKMPCILWILSGYRRLQGSQCFVGWFSQILSIQDLLQPGARGAESGWEGGAASATIPVLGAGSSLSWAAC